MKIERSKFLAALEPLKAALTARTVIAAQTQIWFDKKYAYAHGGSFGIRVAIETPFDFGVPGKLLLGLLDQTSAAEISLESKDKTFMFKAGGSSVKLAILDKKLRPTFYPEPKDKPTAKIKVTKEFVHGLKRVFAIHPPDPPKRLEHGGVCLFPVTESQIVDIGSFDMITTDSKSIASMTIEQDYGGKSIVLPRIFAEQVAAQCDENVELEFYPDHFRVQATKDIALYSNVFDSGKIQDLPNIIDGLYYNKTAAVFAIPDGFFEALERAVLIAGSGDEPIVRLTVLANSLLMTGEFRTGAFREEFDIDFYEKSPEQSVEVRAKPLMSVVNVSELRIGPDAVVCCGKEDGFLYLLALGK